MIDHSVCNGQGLLGTLLHGSIHTIKDAFLNVKSWQARRMVLAENNRSVFECDNKRNKAKPSRKKCLSGHGKRWRVEAGTEWVGKGAAAAEIHGPIHFQQVSDGTLETNVAGKKLRIEGQSFRTYIISRERGLTYI
jgi:hypothetical protein